MECKDIIEIFKEAGSVFSEETLLIKSRISNLLIDQIMINEGIVTEKEFLSILSKKLNIPIWKSSIDKKFLNYFSIDLIKNYQFIPLAWITDQVNLSHTECRRHLIIARINPLSILILDQLNYLMNCHLIDVLILPSTIQAVINEYFNQQEQPIIYSNLRNGLLETTHHSEKLLDEKETLEQPIIRYVNILLEKGIQYNASDIHIEPFEEEVVIRYRIDGSLFKIESASMSLSSAIITRIKIMAQMNIAETRIPQDGRIQEKINGKKIDMRVSTLPTSFGESIVLRILKRDMSFLDLKKLNMPDQMDEELQKIFNKSSGLIIVTGATGVGKTTTLYACMNLLNKKEKKIMTVEDPIEYEMDGLIQIQTNEDIGLSFSSILKTLLRHDPDILMIGETRDYTTASLALQAALTGHLVLTTLHTYDAIGAIPRLTDMGIPPFMLAAALEVIISQRLVRSLCLKCKKPYSPTQQILAQLGLDSEQNTDQLFFAPEGCVACHQTGYMGRTAIFELIRITDPIRCIIYNNLSNIRNFVEKLSRHTLRTHGIQLIQSGITSVTEILKNI